MKTFDFEIVVKKIVDHSIVRHINRKLNTSNRKVEGTLIKSPILVKFAANIVLTTNVFLRKGYNVPNTERRFSKKPYNHKNSLYVTNQTDLNLAIFLVHSNCKYHNSMMKKYRKTLPLIL